MDNFELTNKIIKKYPDYAEQVTFERNIVTPQMGDQPNYDEILNNPALTPQD